MVKSTTIGKYDIRESLDDEGLEVFHRPTGTIVSKFSENTFESDSLKTDAQEVGATISPNPQEDDLQQIILDNPEATIDGQGQRFEIDQAIELSDGITLKNIFIDPAPLVADDTGPSDTVIYTPDGSNYRDIVFQNVELTKSDQTAALGVLFQDTIRTRIINCEFRDLFFGAVHFEGKADNTVEANGPSIIGGHIHNISGSNPCVRCGPERDYLTISGAHIGRSGLGVKIEGENTTIGGGTTISSCSAGCVDIDGSATAKAGNKTKIMGCTLNHAGGEPFVKATDVSRLHISNVQSLINNTHGYLLDGVRRARVSDLTVGDVGGTDSDVIRLVSNAGSCEDNVIENNSLAVYARDTQNAINEADTGATGNVIRQNTAYGTGYSLNSTTNDSGNVQV